jgi:cell division protein FtsA
MDHRALNGGIILTGGGSQLKHLIQLTEYQTGLNARIGFPNEHLASGHIAELTKPMYSTCIGLILKGYNDYERNLKQFTTSNLEVNMPDTFKAMATPQDEPIEMPVEEAKPVRTRKGFSIWQTVQQSLIELFKEEDTDLK